ncbi:MAG TPA: prepilin-type N-terminal cleavage/methylation domain-containing protein [Polyangiaceae bacterium]
MTLIRRGKQRGFTLLELMVVVVIIAILAVIAVPLFAQRFEDRRLQQAGQRIAGIYRGARTRALGRGAAILVRKNGDTFQVLEGVEGTNAANAEGNAQCANLPTRGCVSNTWTVGSGTTVGTARLIETLAIATGKNTVTNDGDETYDVCFSPAGRTWIRKDALWNVMAGAFTIKVANARREYDVVVLPNGIARLGL